MDKVLTLNTIATDWLKTSFDTIAPDILLTFIALSHTLPLLSNSKYLRLRFVVYSILGGASLVFSIVVVFVVPGELSINIISRATVWLAIIVLLIVNTTMYIKFRKSQ
jgi:hypothetical protein